MKKISIILIFLLSSLFTIGQNIRHDQLAPLSEVSSDTVVYVIPDGYGSWKLGKGKAYFAQSATGIFKILPVNSTSITVSYPNTMSFDDYWLDMKAWYNQTIGGKVVPIDNGIYDVVKTRTGFSCKVNSAVGYLKYMAMDTIDIIMSGGFPAEIDPVFSGSIAHDITASDTTRWGSGALAITTIVEDNITDGATTTAPSENAVYDALVLKLDKPTVQTLTYNATNTTMNYSSGADGIVTLTGNITTLTMSNVPDGGEGQVAVIQNATGGYGIAAFAHTGLTIKYINSVAPTSSVINSAANGHSIISYKRMGSYLYITYGRF